MAKNMALIESGTVVNIIWCSDWEPETDCLIDCGEVPAAIGDTYSDGKFYREEQEVLSETQQLRIQNAELLETLAQMVEEVYERDLSVAE